MNINANTASHLDVNTIKFDDNEIKNQYQHLRDIPFCDINCDNVGLLIATHYSGLLIHQDVGIGDPGYPMLYKLCLDGCWLAEAKLYQTNSISCNSLLHTRLESLNENVEQF